MKKTFKQFLQESAHETIGLEIAQKIYHECSDYLQTPRFKSALKKFVSQGDFEDKLSKAKSAKDGKTDALNLRSYFNGETLLHGDVNALTTGNEIMVAADKVYLLNPKFALTGYVLKHLADLMKV